MNHIPHSHIFITNESSFSLNYLLLQQSLTTLFEMYGMDDPEVSILLTTDEKIRDLNKQYRYIDEPTDVLSFPAGEFEHAPLGDIAISIPFAKRQAEKRGVSLDVELAYLVIHGGLHLIGYKDETEEEYHEMLKQMNRIAERMGLLQNEKWQTFSASEI